MNTGEESIGGPGGPTQTKPAEAMAEYRVLLPVDIEGKLYQYGETVELDAATAKAYAHALVSVDAAKGAAAAQAGEETKTLKGKK